MAVFNKRPLIAGLEGLDESDQAIPHRRAVQPTSTECKLMHGSDAKAGWFHDIIGKANEHELQILANPVKGLRGSRNLGKFQIDSPLR